MDLGKTLKFVHHLLESHHISHSLIGGLGLACYGSTRATIDLDLLICGKLLMKLEKKAITLEDYFDFKNLKRKKIQGNQFKL